MITYHFPQGSLDGILSDDYLYFEGVNKPSQIYKVCENGKLNYESLEIMEKYYNDIYNLFLRKLSCFIVSSNFDLEESIKIQALLQELIKVKKIIKTYDNLV